MDISSSGAAGSGAAGGQSASAGSASSVVPGSAQDPLTDAMAIARGAEDARVGLKLLGGLGVRVVCPDYPPRLRRDQDIDFACLAKERKAVMAYLEQAGCQPDRRFNNLNGDRQMYFTAPSGRPIDVMVDKLTMCHTLDFRPSFGRLPHTVDAVDLLLSKLQIIEMNEKDARDIVQLLSCLPVGPAANGAAVLDSDRFGQVMASDWGWWRTVTGNLDKLPGLVAEHPHLAQPEMPFDPLAQAATLRRVADEVPKGVRWRARARVGEKMRWYELPEEVDH
ncbi:MAG: hypothetical protein M0030_32390 [Actinomycetota bacterium]|nr:hypothetical protein [Actinomycetota bacterium]